ncbi:lysine-specific histone demethylase 1 homolog 1-like [Wolffia australiana]
MTESSPSPPPLPAPPAMTAPPSENSQALQAPLDGDAVATQRRRRKRPTSDRAPARTLRGLRSAARRSAVYDEKLLDEIIRIQIEDGSDGGYRRPRRSPWREIDVEAQIASSLGFPPDSLIEEEIESNVVPTLGGVDQANYIVVRNHIVARWRANVSVWLAPAHAMESIRSEHRALVTSAYGFLLEHGYINSGLAPAIKEAGWRRPGSSSTRGNVVVVGAGLAGLAAARHLLSLGFKVAVLEGRLRPGGRVLTKTMAAAGVAAAADLGGSVLTGINGNPLAVLARQLGFPLHKVRDHCPLYRPDGAAVDAAIDGAVEAAFNQLLEKVCKLRETMAEELSTIDVSLGTALEAFRTVHAVAETAEERMLLSWHLANLEYANAALLSDLSMTFWDQDDPYDMGGDHCFIPGGNGRFVKALAENLPIFYGKKVRRVQYGSDGVMVYTGGGEVFRGDVALCTVPLGVLKKGEIEFTPELPAEKAAAIRRLGFGVLNKVALLFPFDFWGGEIDTFGTLTAEERRRGEFFLFYSYAAVAGGPLLVALVAGESAVEFEGMCPATAVKRVMDTLRRIFSVKGIQVPEPVQVVCTRWGADEFAYGSYSYIAVGSSGDDYDVLAESMGDGRVFFAGEATSRKYPATMHGALLSGLREAANISRTVRIRSSSVSEVKRGEVVFDVEEFFKDPDAAFGGFSVLYDPGSGEPGSLSLLRLGFRERKLEAGSGVLYAVVSRKEVEELAAMDRDADRLSLLARRSGTKLVGRKGLGVSGEALISRIATARKSKSVD